MSGFQVIRQDELIVATLPDFVEAVTFAVRISDREKRDYSVRDEHGRIVAVLSPFGSPFTLSWGANTIREANQ